MYNWFFDKEVSKRETHRGLLLVAQCKIPIDLTIIIIVRWLYFVNRCLTKLKSYDNLVCYKITEHSFFVSVQGEKIHANANANANAKAHANPHTEVFAFLSIIRSKSKSKVQVKKMVFATTVRKEFDSVTYFNYIDN
ncbi:hypothetical protein PHYBLDRAFT_68152 [Phycomyces blakesleeanus NRRL 1555(-)]|uniref:Uncharacterized protein n=1 Tax=Phycomyces blakesleeanus (strain ATCC 8743b / DSM 1359 / FGSC 10004 / NBRC 33097 / NRRL 1555) TaxID=763407 RepID=A0A167P116_PHYB8|nr:hypothetical protein PHYBLDRAFT_68152 [Phycomyces blakesleeanus NRRL 1555(-)]OAD77039.1 hypothetical protein PHYBLDRAFT_68152 [Phycomyces blakesleeanus NRRL 1555(-)]|eukprot:XP_018295079.1 hypothetical protein PHYBLDRAFT_68152 [Phycomyces blakesleeanus NRRL 1555(-)]